MLDNFTVALLYEYKEVLARSGESADGPLGACIGSLPSLYACKYARQKVILLSGKLQWTPKLGESNVTVVTVRNGV